MSARMEKYTENNTVKQRTKKHEHLYKEISNMNIDYVDIDVDNAVELNVSGNSRTSREDFQKQRELNKILPNTKTRDSVVMDEVEPKKNRIYDINEILKMAREDKLFEDSKKKRLINTEYNILTKLDVSSLESDELKKEDLKSLIDDIYEKEIPKKSEKVKKYKRSEEAALLNDLFDEKEETDIKIELEENLSKDILDKNSNNVEEEDTIQEESESDAYENEKVEDNDVKEEEVVATQILSMDESNTNTATMYDFGIEKKSRKKKKNEEESVFEGTGEYDTFDEEESEGKGLLIAIIIVVILILITCGFFVYEYFFGV